MRQCDCMEIPEETKSSGLEMDLCKAPQLSGELSVEAWLALCEEAENQGKILKEENERLAALVELPVLDTATVAMHVTEAKYLAALAQTEGLRVQLMDLGEWTAKELNRLQGNLESRRLQVNNARDFLRELKRSTAESALYERKSVKDAEGKFIPAKISLSVIQELENFQMEKEAELTEVRNSLVSLKRRAQRLKETLRKREELSENLHVVDYEQLRIENANLSEKLEERSEEVRKSAAKLRSVREMKAVYLMKFFFLDERVCRSKEIFHAADVKLSQLREATIATKRERDRYMLGTARAKRQAKLNKNTALMEDYGKNEELIAKLRDLNASMKIA